MRENRLRIVLWTGAFALLLIPPIAMRFTDEMNWGAKDFLAAGLLILGAGIAFEVAVPMTRSRAGRAAAGIAIAAVFLIVWAELAVGILR